MLKFVQKTDGKYVCVRINDEVEYVLAVSRNATPGSGADWEMVAKVSNSVGDVCLATLVATAWSACNSVCVFKCLLDDPKCLMERDK